MTIGQAARETGLSADTIRFYEKRGLLRSAARTEGGFRLFGPREIEALKFIRKSQELGFSLDEIRELLFLQEGQAGACEHVRALLQAKIAHVKAKIAELRKLHSDLNHALGICERNLRPHAGSREQCPVLRQLSRHRRAQKKR
ncbi:MAG TPA: heavy metal-responsive transcriptional regulator [Bryobacteraceae bacterium]|nr:heavy metal-responsive transcriptional regulator [Bryobacteraceae bacterium]